MRTLKHTRDRTRAHTQDRVDFFYDLRYKYDPNGLAHPTNGTHTHTHDAQIHALTHARTHAHTHIRTNICTHTGTRAITHARTHAHDTDKNKQPQPLALRPVSRKRLKSI